MRSATNNRFIDVTQREVTPSACDQIHNVFTLAEVAAQQTLGYQGVYLSGSDSSGYQLYGNIGTYYWPSTAFHVLGPAAQEVKTVTSGSSTTSTIECKLGNTPSVKETIVDIYCGSALGVCADVKDNGICSIKKWNKKISLKWEQSHDNGITWFRLPDTAQNLYGNRLGIGFCVPRLPPEVEGYFTRVRLNSSGELESPPNYLSLGAGGLAKEIISQFYGVIDSVRISRGTARYSGSVCQPYNPLHDTTALIDDKVIFALNIGKNEHQKPGGRVIPYYLKNFGWITPGERIYQNNTTITGTEIRNFGPITANVNAYYNLPDGPDADLLPDATISFYDAHNFLSYTTKEAGFRGRVGINFPSTVKGNGLANAANFCCGLFLDDTIVPPALFGAAQPPTREIIVDAATTENIVATFNGKLYGVKRTVDGVDGKPSTGIDQSTKIFLVKDQEYPSQNGIYEVTNRPNLKYPWVRVPLNNSDPLNSPRDDYQNLRIFVRGGDTNAGTVWRCITPNPTLDETEITFVQEQHLGFYKDDFCVEAYFKVASFRHPNIGDKKIGEAMTLIDTYSPIPGGTGLSTSGVKIYMRPLLEKKYNEHIDNPDFETTNKIKQTTDNPNGQILVDIGPYCVAQNDIEKIVDDNAYQAQNDIEKKGPALRSRPINAGVFHHVAVTREKDTFRLYVDGILQDSFISQETTYVPKDRTKEQNYIRYRPRGFWGTKKDRTTLGYARFVVKNSEFFYDRDDVSADYAESYNGAAGMIVIKSLPAEDAAQFINLRGTFGGTLANEYTSPGFPIPNYPAPAHVYIYNDANDTSSSIADIPFNYAPNLRFPIDSVTVDLATVREEETYYGFDSATTTFKTVPIPGRGDITLYGLNAEGSKAAGNIILRFSTDADRVLPMRVRLSTTGSCGTVYFAPKAEANTNASDFKILSTTAATPPPIEKNWARLVASPPGPASYFFVVVPMIAVVNGTCGNIANNSTFQIQPNYTVKCATTVNVPALFGTAVVVDGQTLAVDDVVLIKNQTQPAQNGIYTVRTTAWTRIAGLSQIEQVLYGITVKVTNGVQNANKFFYMSNKSFSTIGNSSMTWDQLLLGIDTTQIKSSNSFSGGTNDDALSSRYIDGVKVVENMRILVKNQIDATQHGIYIAKPTQWIRAPELDSSTELKNELRVFVTTGFHNGGKAYVKKFTTNTPDVVPEVIVLGYTSFLFLDAEEKDADSDILGAVEDGWCAGDGVTVGVQKSVTVFGTTKENITLSGLVNFDKTNVTSATERAKFQYNSEEKEGLILVKNQTDPKENGIYVARNTGAWKRASFLNKSSQFIDAGEVFVAPLFGTDAGSINPNRGYRMNIAACAGTIGWTREQFALGFDCIVVGALEELTKLYLPLNWRLLRSDDSGIQTDPDTNLPTIQPGEKIEWRDFLQTGDDAHTWRLRLKCGKTDHYSRALIVRRARRILKYVTETAQWEPVIPTGTIIAPGNGLYIITFGNNTSS